MISGHHATAEPLRVLFVTHAYPRRAGDAPGLFVHGLAIALSERGVAVRVLAPSAPGYPARDVIAGIPVERFRYAPNEYERLAYTGTMAETVKGSFTGKLALLALLAAGRHALRRAARSGEADVVHAHWWFPSGLVARASALTSPLITTLHGSDVRLATATRGAARLYASVAGASAKVTAVSSWLSTLAATLAPEQPPPDVAPMPVDTTLFTPAGPRDADRLLFVGRLNAQKGLGTLLRALPLVPDAVTLDIVGDGPEKSALRALASELGITSRLRWLGVLEQPALAERYAGCAALVIPSVDEGLGLVAVEAALCETPVIANRSGGLTDVVEHNVTGLLVEPGDASALAATVNDLLSRGAAAETLGREGRRRALTRFSPEAVAERYHDIYLKARETRPA